MNSASEIRAWLMQTPKPALVRVHLEGGEKHDLKCGSAASVGWKKLSETILALPWDRLEAFDEEETLIRATAAGMDEEDESTGTAPPNIAVPVGMDSETARLTLVAQLLANAYRHSTDVAFQRLSDLITAMQRSTEDAERARESFYKAQIKSLETQLRAAGQEPAQGNDMVMGMLANFLGGQAAAASKTTNGAS